MTDRYPLFSDLVRAEIRLHNVVDRRLRAEHGVTVSQHAILRLISAAEDCRVGDIARELVIAVGAASKAVDRLEAPPGWVVRRPNPRNRRSSLLGLTPAGRSVLTQASATADDELRRWLDPALTAPERGQLAAALGRVLAALAAAGAGQPTG